MRKPKVTYVELPDRALVTIDLDDPMDVRDLDGAVVRLVGSGTPEHAKDLAARATVWTVDVMALGALKVIGPEITVIREERERRTELSADVDPLSALAGYLEREGVESDLRDLVLAEAGKVIG